MAVNQTGMLPLVRVDQGQLPLLGQQPGGSKGATLGWEQGNVLTGIVLSSLTSDLFVVNVDGKSVTIQSPYGLVPGQSIALLVEGERQGQVAARLLAPELLETKATPSEAARLQALQVPDSPRHRMALRALDLVGMMPTPERLEQIAAGLEGTGRRDLPAAFLAAVALKSDLPVEAEWLRLLQTFVQSGDNVLNGLDRWTTDLTVKSPSPELTAAINELKAGLKALTLHPQEGDLSKLIQNMAEGKAADRLGAPIGQVLDELGQIGQKGGELWERGQTLLDGLAGRHLWNALDKQGVRMEDYLYVPLLYQRPDGENGQGQLRVYRRPRDQREEGPLRVALILDTASLGVVTVELTLQRQEVWARVTVNDEVTARAGRAAWSDLQEKLDKLGFRLKGDWRVGRAPEVEARLTETVAQPCARGIDIRA
ncbi:hypothetical protein [Heliophilum fasciatum]|uniref:Flagellar hook-length control protein FliK n=1 Tax=Heliophilum fasciatum TaxID=35700 RepID=A0A4R2RLA1_9FIRM|nr:hypothetical protein [Heliophilum fasciatum]MCW2278443.1 hypothetical protein [Heliophilum fasciatum]TCP63658.1 hypothetical protein EDD73_1162 [Heliophilum fasciatum]